MVWTIVGIIAVLLLIDLLVRLAFVPVALRIFESKPALRALQARADADALEVRFPTTHGLTLCGSLYRPDGRSSRGLIIFCPELGGNHWSCLAYCRGLWKAGFTILSFDFRSQGESDRMPGYEPLHWLTDYEVDDVLAAIQYARGQDDLRILRLGLLGVSRGGGAALAAAAKCHVVECVACDSAFSTDSMMLHHARRWATLYVPFWLLNLIPWWHVRMTLILVRWSSQLRKRRRYTIVERWLPHLRNKPAFFIAGANDTYVPPDIAHELSRRIGPGGRNVWIVPGAKHNMARTIDSREYDRRLVEFFSQLAMRTRPLEIEQPQV